MHKFLMSNFIIIFIITGVVARQSVMSSLY